MMLTGLLSLCIIKGITEKCKTIQEMTGKITHKKGKPLSAVLPSFVISYVIFSNTAAIL